MKLNLADAFFKKATEQPDHPLILGQDQADQVSYADFREIVEELAASLKQAGVREGQNIGLLYPSGRDYIAFVYAAWACRACLTPLPSELTASEKQQILDFVHLDAVIVGNRFLSQLEERLDPERIVLTPGAIYAKVESTCTAPPQLESVNAAFIRFTSGTTGNAKGVVLSHESIDERINAANEVLRISKDDRIPVSYNHLTLPMNTEGIHLEVVGL